MNNFVEIKPFVTIPDTSLFLFLTLVSIVILGFLLLFVRFLHNKKEYEQQNKPTKPQFFNLDFQNSKKTAYFITKNAPLLIETLHQKHAFDKLLRRLEKYKYKRHVPSISKDDKEEIKTFLELCDV